MRLNGLNGSFRDDNTSYYGKEMKEMKASAVCKYALAITYGIYMGKFLGVCTKSFVEGLAEGLTEQIKSK